ncbi:PREDICTED: uncharacterized protein LOC108979007 isoform X5 [Bactrocera latifrons]|uniref:Uncharacterized protein n=1 Tax=Bactrocera latifrons TaxID=174628 RepID=A0A0K8UXQ8_BACLA|nr:PREDICTED: uncharacterized protein LOC108979007 isoform X5 [Bactrocera latifrons]
MGGVLLLISSALSFLFGCLAIACCMQMTIWVDKRYEQQTRRADIRYRRRQTERNTDRQGNIFTIANESANNPLPHRFSDFFYVEPSAEEAARIRAQLEKDEKDLPTYEEVMAMSAAQTAAGTLSPPPTTSTTSVATTDTTVPPYSEVNRNGIRAAPVTLEMDAIARPTGNVTVPAAEAGAASTSRAAAAAATSTATTATVVTLANSVSNTSV